MEEKERIHIGTSGWSYKHWAGHFYPPKLKATEWFSYYTRFFQTAEINTSFYHLPKEQTVINWAAKAPEGFIFCAKLSRYITHMKKLKGVEEPLERFFSLFQPLKEKMGPVLVQLPPMLTFHYDVAEAFFHQLTNYKGHEFVLEVRHSTWLQENSLTLMAGYNIGFVISQSNEIFPYAEAITAKNIYVRFHGPNELYASPYTDEMLMKFARKFEQWRGEGHAIWAYFNNDIHGYAFQDAQRLMEIAEKK
jgi:uncharacterized protein YecE (DUF72 family)